MRTAASGAIAIAALVSVAATVRTAVPPTVPCDEVIGQANTGRDGGNRIVLGIVSVPPPYMRQVVRAPTGRWTYWRKAGLVVHASRRTVTVSVPKAWRRHVAITWGSNTGIVSSLRIAACPSPPNVWNAYAGGFYLRSRSACVPLVFRVGGKSRTVRFGIGRRICPTR